jgi:transcriptional regulator GlxA family with amidase domain
MPSLAGSSRNLALEPLPGRTAIRHAGVMQTVRVSILFFDEVEVLDVCGPFEVFSVAARVARRADRDRPPVFVVSTVAVGATTTVVARGGLPITTAYTLDTAPEADIVLVPGGVTRAVEADEALIAWLRARSATTPTIASVCTGALVLATAGLLDGRTATTHWEDLDELRTRFPSVQVDPDARYIDHGDIATSAGVSAGIDLALHLVARFATPELASSTARQMDYPWAGEAANAGRTD